MSLKIKISREDMASEILIIFQNCTVRARQLWTKKTKDLSFCHKLWFSNSYNFATRSPRPLIFQTINSVRSNSLSLNLKGLHHKVAKTYGLENASVWQFKAIIKWIWCFYKANSYTSNSLNHLLSEMGLFTLHFCRVKCLLDYSK